MGDIMELIVDIINRNPNINRNPIQLIEIPIGSLIWDLS